MWCSSPVFSLIPQKEHFGTQSECGLYVLIHPVVIPLGATDLSLCGTMFCLRKKSFPGRRLWFSPKCLENNGWEQGAWVDRGVSPIMCLPVGVGACMYLGVGYSIWCRTKRPWSGFVHLAAPNSVRLCSKESPEALVFARSALALYTVPCFSLSGGIYILISKDFHTSPIPFIGK